jgi:hypothetical protein
MEYGWSIMEGRKIYGWYMGRKEYGWSIMEGRKIYIYI